MTHFNLNQTVFYLSFIFIAYFATNYPALGQYVEFTQITDDDPAQRLPAIYGDYIVFEDETTVDKPDLLLYNITTDQTTSIVANSNSSSKNPDIYENIILWQDDRGGDWEIYIYDINNPVSGGTPLFTWEGDQIEPAIYGDIMVFSDEKPGNTSFNIYMYDFVSEVLTPLTDDTDGDQRNPDV
jgi:beta propeller repeat protein